MWIPNVKPYLTVALVACLVAANSARTQPSAAPQPPPAAAITSPPRAVLITTARGGRQTFAGFGTSLGNWRGDYQKLPAAERKRLSELLWRELKFKTLRLWLNTNEYAPERGQHDLATFRRNYVDSGIIDDATKQGVTTLLLAPDGLPEYMKAKLPDGKVELNDAEVANYATLIADFIQRLKQETGIQLDVTGIQNEPNNLERFRPQQIAAVVKSLRHELDARGLKSVAIIAPEHSSSDGVLYEQVDALKNDPEAWQALGGIASHSYNMAATDEIAKRISGDDGANSKPYWMTEASENGAEEPGDAFRATSLAARFLNDMNHRVTHWIHFLGFEVADPKDNATRIIAYTPTPFRAVLFQKFYYYRQLANTFDVGAVFRDSQSDLDGDMTWTYGLKPHLTAAAARNPDGSWGIGIANYTAASFKGVQGWSDDNWNITQGGHTPGETYTVTIQIEELAGHSDLSFKVHRSSGTLQDITEAPILMKNGRVTVQVRPLELVTLRSSAINAGK